MTRAERCTSELSSSTRAIGTVLPSSDCRLLYLPSSVLSSFYHFVMIPGRHRITATAVISVYINAGCCIYRATQCHTTTTTTTSSPSRSLRRGVAVCHLPLIINGSSIVGIWVERDGYSGIRYGIYQTSVCAVQARIYRKRCAPSERASDRRQCRRRQRSPRPAASPSRTAATPSSYK